MWILYFYQCFSNSDIIEDNCIDLYFDKLKYAADNSEKILQKFCQKGLAARFSYFEKFGEEVFSRLVFDSFVLYPEKKVLGAVLVDNEAMFGHYVECEWNYDWELLYVWYD